jgi:hypothetical protein
MRQQTEFRDSYYLLTIRNITSNIGTYYYHNQTFWSFHEKDWLFLSLATIYSENSSNDPLLYS